MIRIRGLLFSALCGASALRCLWAQTSVDEGYLGVGFLLAAVLAGIASVGRGARAAVFVALAVQAAFAPAMVRITAAVDSLPTLASIYAGILELLGEQVTSHADMLVWRTGGLVHEAWIGFGNLGGFTLGLWLVGGLAALISCRLERPIQLGLRVLCVVILGGALRFLVILLAMANLPEDGVLTSTIIEFLTILPLLGLLPRGRAITQSISPRGGLWRPGLAFLTAVAWIIAIGWSPVGEPKSGRVIIDGRGEWERLDTPFGPEDWNETNAYAYSNLRESLERFYDVQVKGTGEFSAADLSGQDVLILRTPVQPFRAAERRAIEKFVADGGGLFLIGDHTDLFGMTTYINDVAQLFGVTFRPDDTFDLMTEGQTRWRASKLLPHPISHAIGAFDFETSATLAVPLSARVPVMGYAMGTDEADYSRPGFFGDLHLSPNERFGFLPQMAVLPFGNGRVAAVSDSTPFSNFSLYFPGRRELVLSTVDWLNRDSGWLETNLAFLSLVFCAGATALLLSDYRSRLEPSATAMVVGFAVGLLLLFPQRAALEVRPPPEDVNLVLFEDNISSLNLPDSLRTPDQELDTLDAFYLSVQRLGAVPQVLPSLEDLPSGADLIVMARPQRSPTSEEIAILQRFVVEGGSLLVLDGFVNPGPATNEILGIFGVAKSTAFTFEALDDGMPRSSSRTNMIERVTVSLSGLEIKLRTMDGDDIYGQRAYGAGKVAVMLGAEGLTARALGARFMVTPNSMQKRSVRTVLGIFADLLGVPYDPEPEP